MFYLQRLFFLFHVLVIIFVGLKSLTPGSFSRPLEEDQLVFYHNQTVSFFAFVCAESDLDYRKRRLTLCLPYESGRVLINTNLYPEYNYGDFLLVKGYLQAPGVIEDFDYSRYLALYKIYSVMYYPKLELASSETSFMSQVFENLLQIKWSLKRILERALPESEAGLATALLLGYRHTIYPDDVIAFSRTGLSHLIAISGSHITIISGLLAGFLLLLGFSRRITFRILLLFLFIYPLLTGLSASAIRASLMGGLVLIAAYYGRLAQIERALVLAAAWMLIFNPRLFRDDVGFQLSFLAILGILYLYPLAAPITARLKRKGVNLVIVLAWQIFSLTLACQLAVLPIMLIKFKQFSLIAFLANPLVSWLFPLILGSLIIPLFIVALLPGLSHFLFFPAYLLLTIFLRISRFLADFPWAARPVAGFNWLEALIYYCFLIGFVLRRKILQQQKLRPSRRSREKVLRLEKFT